MPDTEIRCKLCASYYPACKATYTYQEQHTTSDQHKKAIFNRKQEIRFDLQLKLNHVPWTSRTSYPCSGKDVRLSSLFFLQTLHDNIRSDGENPCYWMDVFYPTGIAAESGDAILNKNHIDKVREIYGVSEFLQMLRQVIEAHKELFVSLVLWSSFTGRLDHHDVDMYEDHNTLSHLYVPITMIKMEVQKTLQTHCADYADVLYDSLRFVVHLTPGIKSRYLSSSTRTNRTDYLYVDKLGRKLIPLVFPRVMEENNYKYAMTHRSVENTFSKLGLQRRTFSPK